MVAGYREEGVISASGAGEAFVPTSRFETTDTNARDSGLFALRGVRRLAAAFPGPTCGANTRFREGRRTPASAPVRNRSM